MKETMEFDFHKFIERLKELNTKNGYNGVKEEASDEDVWMVKGYQDCLEDVIEVFKECLK